MAQVQGPPVDTHGAVGVGWLKNGRLLAYDDDDHIVSMNADGSDRNIVFETNLPILNMSVCPNSDRVLLAMPNPQTKSINIFRMDVASGKPTAVTNGKYDQNAVCSPDGTFFFYTTLIKGKQLAMRMEMSGGQPKQLSDEYVIFGAISPDSQQVALMTVEGTGVQITGVIKVIPAAGGAPVKSVPEAGAISGGPAYAPDGKAVYYPVTEKGVSNLVKQSLDGGPPTAVTDFNELTVYSYSYNWSANKLAITRGKVNSDVVAITQQAAQ
jgi:Tol biopolymer transport system component